MLILNPSWKPGLELTGQLRLASFREIFISIYSMNKVIGYIITFSCMYDKYFNKPQLLPPPDSFFSHSMAQW